MVTVSSPLFPSLADPTDVPLNSPPCHLRTRVGAAPAPVASALGLPAFAALGAFHVELLCLMLVGP
eukprot:6711758-Pyramimonas_sp.AAC.1